MPSSILLAVWVCSGQPATPDKKAPRALLRNSIVPGQLTRHDFQRERTRTAQRGGGEEVLQTRQAGYWLQCNIDAPRGGRVMLYQMMVDAPARVVSFRHGKKRFDPPPSAEQFSLDKGSTKLLSERKSSRDAPVQTPLCEMVERVIFANLLDFAHWPAKTIDAGHRWQRDIRTAAFEGTQTFEFVDLAKVEGRTVARVTLFVKGKFKGDLAQEYAFDKGQAIIHWSRMDGALAALEAQADFTRRRGPLVEKHHLKLDAKLARTASLDEKVQEAIKGELSEFASALEAERSDDLRAAASLCAQFRAAHPQSLWLPAIDELAGRVDRRTQGKPSLSIEQLQEAVGRALVAFEAGRTNHDYDLLDRARTTLRQIGRDYGARLAKLAKDKSDENRRAQAVFALALSARPGDFAAAQKYATDESAKIRAMALAGLTVRSDPGTSVELLLAVLDDEMPAVRRRACQAVAACVPREHFSVSALVEKLGRLMIHDKSDGVRRDAIQAIAAIGAPSDVPRLEKALKHELNAENRAELERGIARLNERK